MMGELARPLDDSEMLAFIDALGQECKRLTDQKDPSSLRSKVDRQRRKRYEEDRTGDVPKTTPLRIGDVTVGYHQLKYSKPKSRETSYQLQVEDYVTCGEWLQSVADKYIRKYVERDLKAFAAYYFDETGEMPDGCFLSEITTMEQPSEFIGTAVKVNQKDVIEAMQHRLPESGAVLRLLGGGRE